ncbi:MAG TPA: UvrB/UvrC motif-containing protein [Planctomycetota bacterium]|nr:UvrB/UvrC motif-containing protein [Planctomycetota bacterium]
MTCEKCKKNHATYHLTAKENGQMREAHLCEECAKQAGVTVKFNFSIPEVLGSLLDVKPPTTSGSKANQLRCPECGITYAEFKTKARLGCANDYEVFRTELVRLLEKIHGATSHAGKTPQTADSQVRKENELIRLKRDLESVVKSEDFEKAAMIRDRIRSLEHELNP